MINTFENPKTMRKSDFLIFKKLSVALTLSILPNQTYNDIAF